MEERKKALNNIIVLAICLVFCETPGVEVDVVGAGVDVSEEAPVHCADLRRPRGHVSDGAEADERPHGVVVGDAVVAAALNIDRDQVGSKRIG